MRLYQDWPALWFMHSNLLLMPAPYFFAHFGFAHIQCTLLHISYTLCTLAWPDKHTSRILDPLCALCIISSKRVTMMVLSLAGFAYMYYIIYNICMPHMIIWQNLLKFNLHCTHIEYFTKVVIFSTNIVTHLSNILPSAVHMSYSSPKLWFMRSYLLLIPLYYSTHFVQHFVFI